MDKAKFDKIIHEMTEKIKELLGDKLCSIILYGSYARGDFDLESDIDIMVLTNANEKELKRLEDIACEFTWGLGMEHNILISTLVNNIEIFNLRLPAIPFYQNVKNEGGFLYDSKAS